MNKEKQIEEMAKYSCTSCEWAVCGDQCLLDRTPSECDLALTVANTIYNAGYRKQSEGEWIDTGDFELDNIYSGWKCSLCGHIFCGCKTNFCSNCGAKMKGERYENQT